MLNNDIETSESYFTKYFSGRSCSEVHFQEISETRNFDQNSLISSGIQSEFSLTQSLVKPEEIIVFVNSQFSEVQATKFLENRSEIDDLSSSHSKEAFQMNSKLIEKLNKNISLVSERIKKSIFDNTLVRLSSVNQIIQYLFGNKKASIGAKFTRAHLKMLKLADRSEYCKVSSNLIYSQHNLTLYHQFMKFTTENSKVLKSCHLKGLKSSQKSNSYFWSLYFSSEVVIQSFQMFVDIVFSEPNKELLMTRINHKYKLKPNENPNFWVLRKESLKNFLFIKKERNINFP